MSGKKNVKSAGRYGTRYGLKARRQVSNIEGIQKKSHICPGCNYTAVKRKSTAIWECRHCGLIFAGGAYYPVTDTARGKYISLVNILEGKGGTQ